MSIINSPPNGLVAKPKFMFFKHKSDHKRMSEKRRALECSKANIKELFLDHRQKRRVESIAQEANKSYFYSVMKR